MLDPVQQIVIGDKLIEYVIEQGGDVHPEDLIRYGLIPELVGRLPVITSLEDLTEDDLVQILIKPRNCMVRQYQKLMAMEGIDLTFTDASLKDLAKLALKRKTGARGLRSIVEKIMLEVMFEAPQLEKHGSIRITRKMVQEERATLATTRALKIA